MNKARCTVFMMLLAGFISTATNAQDAHTIVQKMDDVLFAGEDQHSHIRMILTDRRGNERTREAEVWQKGDNHRLFRFTAPAAEAGIAFLSLPDEVMYLYMPAFGGERRIASHVKNQSFAGTDFTYEDLEAERYSERFSSSLVEETDETGQVYVVEMTPLPNTRSDYSRIIAYINKTYHYPEKMESFDRSGQKAKVATYVFERQGDYWFTKEIRMENLLRNHSTLMIFDDVVFDSGLGDEIFTVRNLLR